MPRLSRNGFRLLEDSDRSGMLALNSFLKIGQGELADWPRRLYEVGTDVAVDLADGDGAGRREARHRRSACSSPSRLARVGDSGFPIPARNGARARHRRRGNVGGKGGAAQAAAEATGGREGGDGWLVGGEARRLCWLLSCLNPDRNSNGRADRCWLQNPTAQEARNARIETHFPPAESPITSRTASSWPLPIATLNLRPAGTHPLVLRLATEACRTLEWASSVGLISGYAHVLFDETPSKVNFELLCCYTVLCHALPPLADLHLLNFMHTSSAVCSCQ